MRAIGDLTRLGMPAVALTAVGVLCAWCPPPSFAGITVLCEPVDCMAATDCGPSGTCSDGNCSCASDSECPAGSQCLVAQAICVVCPATPTPSATSTATETATPSVTPPATATGTAVPQGGACTTPSQCSTDFCVDAVCCATACDQPGQVCNQPGSRGVCSASAAAAPALTAPLLLIAVGLLAGLGAYALRRSVRGTP